MNTLTRRLTHRHSSGQAMLIAAASFAALAMMLALAVNVGMFFAERRHLQNAADAAALAGAAKLVEEHAARSFRDAPVLEAISVLAQQNDVDVGGSRHLRGTYYDQSGNTVGAIGQSPLFAEGSIAVEVELSGGIPTILPGIVGPSSISVRGIARAGLAPAEFPSSVVGTIPLAAPLAAFQAGAGFDLYDQSVAFMAHGIQPYRPFLDLVNLVNGGSGYQPAADFLDPATNLQFWSDGLHPAGQIGIGNTVAVAVAPASGDFHEQVRAGLLDNVRRQGLVDSSGAAYALVDIPLWDQYVPGDEGGTDSITVAGFARFKIVQDEITTTTLRGHFVPFTVQHGVPGGQTAAPWGPSRIALLL